MKRKIISSALSHINDEYIMEAATQVKSKTTFFQRWGFIAAAILVLFITVPIGRCFYHGGTSDNPIEEWDGSPITYFDTLEELNQAIGCNIQPVILEGLQEEAFTMIDCDIAEYSFEWNEGRYIVCAGKTTDDISGIYLDNGKMISEECEEDTIISADGFWFVKWFAGDMQYNLIGIDSNVDAMNEVYKYCK